MEPKAAGSNIPKVATCNTHGNKDLFDDEECAKDAKDAENSSIDSDDELDDSLDEKVRGMKKNNAVETDTNVDGASIHVNSSEHSLSSKSPSSDCSNSAPSPSQSNKKCNAVERSTSHSICNNNNNCSIIIEGGHFSTQRRIIKGRRLVSPKSSILRVAPTNNPSAKSDEYHHHHNHQVFPLNNHKSSNQQHQLPQQLQQLQQQPTTSTSQNLSRTTNRAVRRVQIVSKRAALASKRKIWDSNDASIDAAQSAVDKWESSYQTFRTFLINFSKSAKQIYKTTKSASQKIENSLLVPIRDIVLLPTFNGIEKATDTTIGFLQSDEAKHVALQSLEVIKRQTPFGIGENVIAPCLVSSFEIMTKAWEIAQYPIPSKADVRFTVDTIMTGTKWFLLTSTREIYFYAKLVDATVTRTLSHTQWKVLGSGPYSTLNSTHKEEVINHLCERYFSLKDDKIARYELTAHIKFYNPSLYRDLVATGLLRERGGEFTTNDAWLKPYPDYRAQIVEDDDSILLLQQKQHKRQSGIDVDGCSKSDVKPLWFYQPTQNGKKPKKDTPWVCFDGKEQSKIEDGFISFLYRAIEFVDDSSQNEEINSIPTSSESMTSVHHEQNEGMSGVSSEPIFNDEQRQDDEWQGDYHQSSLPFNMSHWYQPNLNDDILIEQKRHAISFLPHHAYCELASPNDLKQRAAVDPSKSRPSFGSYCKSIVSLSPTQTSNEDIIKFSNLAFPLTVLMRPTLWRFHGQGNVARRGVWMMDTQRNGLQPYSDESAAILEEAYLFLKWTKSTQDHNVMSKGENKGGIESVLLTVQVLGPDGDETQLVQFRSLTQITAIQKTIAGGFSLFKRRVYRGAQMMEGNSEDGADCQNEENITMKALLAAPYSLHQSFTRPSQQNNVVDDATTDHLILVIHGIGEMLRSTDIFGMSLPPMTSTIVDCCSSLRKNHAEVLEMHHDSNPNSKSSLGNVEFLPVEWHEPFALRSRWSPRERKSNKHSQHTKDAVTLKDISLNTIPHMREFANDTMLDILFFMSPMHHDIMIDIVCTEMNTVVQKFRALTGFEGKVSLLAHSLGSVISWDILSRDVPPAVNQHDANDVVKSTKSHGIQSPYTSLDFRVSNTFMIGSPVAVFLMLRNQHEPIQKDFYLPGCPRVFNIFHPYDPVAYRIEPLLARENAFAEPEIIAHWKGGFRVQYQTKFLWRKIIDEVRVTQKSVVKAVEAGIEGIGLLDQSGDDLLEDEIGDESSLLSDDSCFQTVQVGNVCEGNRLDYMLQEKEIENANEYLSALAAHSSYWGERDLSLFMTQNIYESEDEASFDIMLHQSAQEDQPNNNSK